MQYLIDTSEKFSGIIIDRMVNGKTAINGHTLQESADWHKINVDDLSIVTEKQMKQLVDQDRLSKIEGFSEITEERFDHMLGVLPPVNYTGNYFQLSEALQYDLRATFYQVNGKFYEATLPSGTIQKNSKYIDSINL